MQKFFGIGRLGQDAEVFYTKKGNSVIKFSVAFNYFRYKATQTLWLNVEWFVDKLSILDRLRKGVLVYVEGIIESGTYTSSAGYEMKYFKLCAERVEILSNGEKFSGNKVEEYSGKRWSKKEIKEDEDVLDSLLDDDVPF